MAKTYLSRLNQIKIAHCVCFVFVICLAILVDSNGNILNLGQVLSALLATAVFGAAGIFGILLVIVGRGLWRILGFFSLLLYCLFLLPLAIG